MSELFYTLLHANWLIWGPGGVLVVAFADIFACATSGQLHVWAVERMSEGPVKEKFKREEEAIIKEATKERIRKEEEEEKKRREREVEAEVYTEFRKG